MNIEERNDRLILTWDWHDGVNAAHIDYSIYSNEVPWSRDELKFFDVIPRKCPPEEFILYPAGRFTMALFCIRMRFKLQQGVRAFTDYMYRTAFASRSSSDEILKIVQLSDLYTEEVLS